MRKHGEARNQLLVNIEDEVLDQNIRKRNANYEYFLQRVAIDKKYEEEQLKKSKKLQQKNKEKLRVLKTHQLVSEYKEEENLLKKFVV